MRGDELLTAALGLMFETSFSYGDEMIAGIINHVLRENAEINSILRSKRGKPEAENPGIAKLSDELGFEPELENALTLGLLCRLYADEENPWMLSLYRQEYAAAQNLVKSGIVFPGVISDEY